MPRAQESTKTNRERRPIRAAIRFAFLGLLAFSQPVHAQQDDSMRDAARANVLGLTYWCVEVMFRRANSAQAFPAAGFPYRLVDRGFNQSGTRRAQAHYFDAPANTAHAEVDATNRPAGLCRVYTRLLSQPEVEAIVGSTLRQYYPTVEQRGSGSWSVRSGGSLPLLIDIYTIGNNNRYESPGTVQVSMTYPG